jgi:hypothetical protein
MTQISQISSNHFVRFYTEVEAQNERLTQPHQYLVFDFEDFMVGSMRESSRTYETSRDSVLVGTTTVNGKSQNVFGRVKAEVTTTRREVTAESVLAVRIIDAAVNRIEQHRNFPGKFVWSNEWSTYKGDDRALTDEEKKRTNTKPLMPPSQQDLFIECTKPIFDQTVRFVKDYYTKYW